MPYDPDQSTAHWFAVTLASPNARTRLRAVELLREVDAPQREAWLRTASDDSDPLVAATATVVAAAVRVGMEASDDLLESDFATGREGGDLEWEWEYTVVVCRGQYAPLRGVLVWIRTENDTEAKRLAVLKACTGQPLQGATPLVVGKRFVNRYTRSARSFQEAMRWHRDGRPRFTDG